MRPGSWRVGTVRWLKFNLVGAIGIAVQLTVLIALISGLHVDYLAATALAVEAAVVHNFFWHERFTWADRPRRNRLLRCLKFNLTTGAVSILGNIALMELLVGIWRLPYLAGNLAAITLCSLANFAISDRIVFVRDPGTAQRECRLDT